MDVGTSTDLASSDLSPTPDLATGDGPVLPPSIAGLKVSGNQLVNGANQPLHLHGVNRSGTEYACVQGWGLFDGPSDAASVQAIQSWKANAVRIPLNEDCWLAINGVSASLSGSLYQQAIIDYVNLVNQHGMVAIVELHWSAPGTTKATQQLAMPDRDHSVTFWSQVATAFKNNSSVIFEPFNEPFPDSNADSNSAWTCWRDGGTCSGVSFTVAGMQELVTAIRATGATNVISLGGVQYSNSLSQWITHKPTDPMNNLAASWHVYNFNTCNTASCYDSTVGPVAMQVPILTTEIGEDDCAGGFITTTMSWLDQHGQSYLGWTWDTWGGCLVLITDYAGTPAGTYGQTYQAHLATF